MTDVFAKALADLKLGDFAGDVPAPPKLQQPTSLDILREQGVAGITGSRRNSIDVVGDLIRMEQDKKKLAELQGASATALALPSWADAVGKIAGFEALPYEQKKKLHDEYVQQAVAKLREADPKTDQLLLEQKIIEQAPAPVDPTGGKGDVSRAWSSGIANTKAAATGALGFVLSKFGADAQAKEMFDAMATYTKEAQDLGKANDTLSEALKPGGDLVDWAQYNVGQILPSLVESLITGAAGAAVGSATGGVGAIPMAVAGAVGKTALKKKFAQTAAEFMREQATKNIASGMTRQAALTAAREATETELKRAAGKTLGGMAGIFGAAYARGVGEIAQNAQQAGLDPAGLKGLEVLSGAGLYAAMEGMSDKLLLGALKGTAGGLVKRTLKRGAGTALAEGATEVGQDTVTGIAAGVGAPDGLELFNAFAAGAVGGGVVGGAGAALRPASDTTPAPTVDPNATPEPTDEELAAMPADTSTVAAGTTMGVEGATLVLAPNGAWQYAPGSPTNAEADSLVSLPPNPALATQPSAPVAVPTAVEAGVEPLEAGNASSTPVPTVETTPDGDIALASTPTVVERTLAPLRAELAEPAQAPFEALQNANRIIARLTPEERRAEIETNPNGALAQFTNQLGLQMTIGMEPEATWARSIREDSDGETVLRGIAISREAGMLNRSLSGLLQSAFQAAGVAFPSVAWQQNPSPIQMPDGRQNTDYLGTYSVGEHRVRFNPRTTANTVVHEFMHALTVKGLQRLQRFARAGDQNAANVLQLIREMHTALRTAAAGTTVYGNQSIEEMYAELVRPEFIALAARTPMLASEASAEARAGAAHINANQNGTMLEAISRLITYILNKITGETSIPHATVLGALKQTAAYLASQTAYDLRTATGEAQQLDGPMPTATAGTRVTPGQALPLGTLVEETPRDRALLPEETSISAMRNDNPRNLVTSEALRRWYFQPGVIVPGYGGRDVVLEYRPGPNGYDWSVLVQSLDREGRTDESPRTHSTAPVVIEALRSLPSDMAQPATVPRTTATTAPRTTATTAPRTPVGVPALNPTPEQTVQPTAAPAKRALNALQRLGSRVARLADAAGQLNDPAFRGVQPRGALATSVPQTAPITERIAQFHAAMQEGIAQLNAASQGTQNRRTWRYIFVPGSASYSVSVDSTTVASGNLNSSGKMNTGTTGFGQTAERGTEDALGNRFYDVYYGALASAGIQPYLGGGLWPGNIKRMPINRLRAMLKYGTAIGNPRTRTVLGLGQSNLDQFPGYVAVPSRPDASLLLLLQKRVRETFGANPVMNPDGSYTFGDRTMTRRELRDFALSAGHQSPDELALVALSHALGAPNADTNALVETFISTNLSQGPMLFSNAESVEDLVPEPDTAVRIDRRTSTGALAADIRAGVPASAATPTRGLLQAAQARDKHGVSKALSAFGERLNEELHDASIRMKRWLQTLPEVGSVTQLMKQRVIGSMYTARKKRDDALRRFYDEHLAEIDKLVTKFAASHGLSTETATRDIGYATTAKTIPARNAFLLRKRIKALQALKAQLDAAEADAAAATASTAGMVPAAQAAAASAPGVATVLDELRTQYAQAQVQLTELVAAINNQNIRVKKHGGGGVAGMNNAQAADILDGLRQRYGDAGFAQIEAIANRIYDMNAAKLAFDIESGKVTPAAAATFLEKPAALPVLQELRELANAVDASNTASVKALEAKRKEAIAAVRTEYVPLSGDPTKDIDDSSFHGGSGIPNVQRDYELQGRERGAPPDDGLSASRAALMKSASYYGWRDFQDGIAAIHSVLTKEQREAVGIRAELLPSGRSTLSNKAVIRHRNGKTTAYIFADETLVDAIRGASRLENNFLLEGAGKVTKLYSYLATQANPFFAPFNFIRDSWERSEFLRTRTYLRADGSKADSKSIAHGMLKYLADPSLMQATARYAFGKPLDTDSRTGRYLDEFLRQGGVSVFSSQFGADRAKIIAQINKQKSWRQQLGTLSRWIDGYNKTFDVGPALASYMAMRDAGMNTKDAAAGALDLMDFGKRGKSASIFGSVYAFAQPTFTGAANMLTAIRDPLSGKMNPVGVARLGAYVAGFLMLQAFLRSLADDDEGGNKLDQQSDFTKNGFLLIPYGESGMIKVPLAYGWTRVANGIARAALGLGTNEQTPGEAVGKIGDVLIPAFSPIEDSDIDWFERPAQALLTLFAPSWLKPPLALATNTTPFDSQIINSKYADPTKFKSEQFGKYAPESYKDMARALRSATGIDMAPEEIRYLFRGYPTGVAQLLVQGPLEDKTVGEAAHRKVYAEYSEFARYFQFKKAIDETDDLLKRTKAGEQITDAMERRKLMWRLQWDETDKELRSAKGKATRAATKAGLKTDAVDGQFADVRMASQVRALYYYRLMQGKDAVVGEPPDLE